MMRTRAADTRYPAATPEIYLITYGRLCRKRTTSQPPKRVARHANETRT
jgi:hypothetical protein